MLFRPYKPKGIGPFKIQGVFPAKKAAFARQLGSTVEDRLLTAEDIAQSWSDVINDEVTETALRKRLKGLAPKLLLENFPMAAMFVKGELGEKIDRLVSDELIRQIKITGPELLASPAFQGKIAEIIAAKVQQIDDTEFEAMLLGLMKREFRAIELFGALLGFIIGAMQLLFYLFIYKS